ncbi:MAG: putative house-cleaning noncanonical NTP pyrophosphatase (MazG superfamily) [Flavobacteriales bacterium]|jgi:predicted house-cleaning noncanonical NTP pyrophosphatase (MazG superfamily)
MFRFFYLLIILLAFSSCNGLFKPKAVDKVVARVYDNYLRKSEIDAAFPRGLSKDDSLDFANNFVQQWATNLLVLQKADVNLTDAEKSIETRVRNYRNSLLKYAYQQQMLSSILDTVIPKQEIEDYYNSNLNNFKLRTNIVKVAYATFSAEAPESSEFVKKFRYGVGEEDKEYVEDYCFKYASDLHLNDSLWMSFDELISKVSIHYSGKTSRFLRYNSFYESKEADNWVIVRFYDYLLEGAQAPIDFVRPNIESIILNSRKIESLKKMERDLFNNALQKKHLEIL